MVLAELPGVELLQHVVVEAERLGMHDSPTLLLDGTDPFAASGTLASVSCRLYRAADGRGGGAPTPEDLRRVFGVP